MWEWKVQRSRFIESHFLNQAQCSACHPQAPRWCCDRPSDKGPRVSDQRLQAVRCLTSVLQLQGLAGP